MEAVVILCVLAIFPSAREGVVCTSVRRSGSMTLSGLGVLRAPEESTEPVF